MVQILPHTIAITLALFINAAADPDSITLHNVKVFYYLLPDWGESLAGTQSCPNKNMSCHWEYSGNITQLVESFDSQMSLKNASNQSITVTMYNIHSLWHKLKKFYPMNCSLKTDLSIACSEESSKHPSHSILFPKSFPNFDGYSTTHPSSSVQKIYKEAYLNQTTLDFHTANSMKSFPQLIKAGTYIASACHNKHGAESTRDKIVKAVRAAGFRIDGLGGCLKSPSPEGIVLNQTDDTEQNLILKRRVIAKYMFNMAFENIFDPGYVTEKPWDALFAGTVPVYWGDHSHLKSLLPHPKAAIFAADFKEDYQKLANYLSYLSLNETAYEEHRAWRKEFNSTAHIENHYILRNTWYCRTCEWAINKMVTINNEKNKDSDNKNYENLDGTNITQYKGRYRIKEKKFLRVKDICP